MGQENEEFIKKRIDKAGEYLSWKTNKLMTEYLIMSKDRIFKPASDQTNTCCYALSLKGRYDPLIKNK
jgi:hypothetical protein